MSPSLMFQSTPDPQTGTLIPASRILMHYHSSLPQSAQITAACQGSEKELRRPVWRQTGEGHTG